MMELHLADFKLQLVSEADAEFIVELRSNQNLAKHLHQTSSNVGTQREWIKRYKEREALGTEFYFISVKYNGEKLGLNRIYNIKPDSFELGSWIFKKGIEEVIPILSDIAVRDFAYNKLGLQKCFFDVRKNNKSVIRYHHLFEPKVIDEDDMNYYFELDYSTYNINRQKILKLIDYGL
ncbi:hypothetical protein AAE02nite_08930 [Adhaeribacter aerolatus]|uniref:N-acetyltransferase domain-containing protein n=1 Tax=Adhaeribacter aerolatus TaxID=670289 RepID=A0A512AU27_9BACT|nr:GNAT family N-acetyltransferase [Adhaeribacter aerolatus]GEO03229.1 hypothetical protein AAE02nite_08930 [Adhaeribacter aerolatus]